jgi:two-component system phosphate regulon response regulator PhoB
MAKTKTLFIVEDEEDIVEILSYNLKREGFSIEVATDGDEALKKIPEKMPDIILLDRMLPGADGFEICRELKNNPATKAIPIIMVTAKGEESDVVSGLELGADDYITKPFSMKILIARINTVFRRGKTKKTEQNSIIKIKDLVIDQDRRTVHINKKPVEMTFTEFSLLHYLAGRPGRVMSRDQIIDAVRGEDYAVTDRAVDVQIVGLRKKLGKYSDWIQTVRGVGYRFRETGDI